MELPEVNEAYAALSAVEHPAEQLARLAELELAVTFARERVVAELVVASGWTYQRVAETLGITRQGASKRYARVVAAYRQRWREQRYGRR